MKKSHPFLLFICFFLFIQVQLNADCIVNLTYSMSDNGAAVNGFCPFEVELCATVTGTEKIRRIVFKVGTQFFNYNPPGNLQIPTGKYCHTFYINVPCANPVTSASIFGYNNNGNGPGNNSGGCGGMYVAEIGPGSGALPVELVSFNARLMDNDEVMIEWVTASEENNDYFELQHSTDGKDFRPITTIEGKGTTSETQYYKYYHRSPERGNNYYRIKQVDFDGKYTIFDVVVVKKEAATIFQLFPSQTYSELTFESPITFKKDLTVDIYNCSGALMISEVLAAESYKIKFDVQDFPSGIYFVRFVNENNEYSTKKFVTVRE